MQNSRSQTFQTIGSYCRWLSPHWSRKWFQGDWNREQGSSCHGETSTFLYTYRSPLKTGLVYRLTGTAKFVTMLVSEGTAVILLAMKSEWHLFCLIDMFIETVMSTLKFILSLCMEARLKLSSCLGLLGNLTTGTHHYACCDLKYFEEKKKKEFF